MAHGQPFLHKVPSIIHYNSIIPNSTPVPAHTHPRTMADNAFEWAKPLGRWRVNAIHKVEEADIPYDDSWCVSHESGTRVEFSGSAAMDDPFWH